MKKDLSNIKKSKLYLDKNECIGIPTETVYGLAADAANARLPSAEDLCHYLGCIENGQSCGPELPGDAGVGTFGGSEDHTAIMGCAAGRLERALQRAVGCGEGQALRRAQGSAAGRVPAEGAVRPLRAVGDGSADLEYESKTESEQRQREDEG